MTKTPRTDALVADPLNSNDVRAWQTLAAGLEAALCDLDAAKGILHTKLKSAVRERDGAIVRAHDLRLEAKGYHHSLMRCEGDAKRWQYWRKRGIDLSGESGYGAVYKVEADAYTDGCLDGRIKPAKVRSSTVAPGYTRIHQPCAQHADTPYSQTFTVRATTAIPSCFLCHPE